jgi:fructose-1,6-bisphosphatase/inositol monophosphatase family enzyme
MKHHPLDKLQETAVRSVRVAGDILLDRYNKIHRVDDTPPYDLKLRIDHLCEEAILNIILDTFPDHGIITEESGSRETSSGYVWIIDPLDGTVNYYHGLPHFSSCVACYYKEERNGETGKKGGSDLSSLGNPLVGVVFSPVSGELFTSAAGQGATCNGKEIHVRTETDLREAVIGISYGSDENTMKKMELLSSKLIRGVRKVRIFGSTSLDMAQVACGRISGLIQGHVRNWDFAAARIILEESGGTFHAEKNGDNAWEIIACAPGIFSSLKQLMINGQKTKA